MRRWLETVYGLYAAVAFGIVIFLITSPLIVLGPTLPLRRWFGRTGVRLALLLCGTPLRVEGRQHLPAGACLVVSNHASYLDGLLLTAALPGSFSFVVQHGAERWPVVGPVIKRMGVIFVNRGEVRASARTTRRLMRSLHAGEPLAVFPEGTFRARPGLLPFRPGAFLIAARTQAPVVPAVIQGSRRWFSEGQWLPRPTALRITLFPALRPAGSDRAAALQLRDAARAVIAAHCGEPDTLIARPQPICESRDARENLA